MRELIISAMRDACLPYLAKVLARAPEDKHPQITSMFNTHMAFLADYCIAGYGGRGALTEAFICGLHKVLFPPDYKQVLMTTPEGEVVYMVPGEYKRFNNGGDSYLHPNGYVQCIAPEDVQESMAKVVNTLTALVAATSVEQKRGAVLRFVVDFLMIHPFGDANGRVAYMLADLLAITEGLSPFYLTSIKEKDLPAFYRVLELVREKRDLTPLYEVIERYNPAALGLGTPCPTTDTEGWGMLSCTSKK